MPSKNLKVYYARTEKYGAHSSVDCQSTLFNPVSNQYSSFDPVSANLQSWVSVGAFENRIMFPPLKSEPKTFSTN